MQSSSRNSVLSRLVQVWTFDQVLMVRGVIASPRSELVGEAAEDRPALPIEAVAAAIDQAGRDMGLVEQVHGIDLEPPVSVLPAEHGVEQHIVGRRDGGRGI